MTSDNSPLCNLWQSQPQESFQMSVEELREKRKRLHRELLIRDSTIWFLCLFEIAWFGWILVVVPQLVAKVGSILIMLGMAFLNGQVWLDQRNRRRSRERAGGIGQYQLARFLPLRTGSPARVPPRRLVLVAHGSTHSRIARLRNRRHRRLPVAGQNDRHFRYRGHRPPHSSRHLAQPYKIQKLSAPN